MRTSIPASLFISLVLVGCGGGDSGTTTTDDDTGRATEETATGDTRSDDTGATTADTGSSADDTGLSTTDSMSTTDSSMATDTKMDAPVGAATFTQVYAIITAKCGSCHTTMSSGNLDMGTKMNAYSNLVGKKASGAQCLSSGLTRVVAGMPDTSLMYQKVTKDSAAVCGDSMPRARPVLPAGEIATIRSWILDGAKDN